jgi:glycosyltransferase involved in cell wall biosynthesis
VHRLPLQHRRASRARYVLEYGAFPVLAARKLAHLHRRRQFDVVQVNTLPDHLVFAAALPKRLGARVVLDLHEPMPELYVSKFGPSPRMVGLVTAVERASTNFADRVIAVHETHREVLEARGVPAEKLTVVLNSADERIFHRPDVPPPPGAGFVLISHGTLLERLGFDEPIRAVGILRDRVPDLRLVLVGDGEHAPALRRLAAELGVQDRVAFLGQRPLEQIPQHLLSAHVGVVPIKLDVFTDLMLPTKLLEYVAMGIPAVVARTRTIEAYFDDSSVAFFRPGDPGDLARAIAELAANRGRARQQAANAEHKFLSRHSWGHTKQVYGELIGELAWARPHRASNPRRAVLHREQGKRSGLLARGERAL